MAYLRGRDMYAEAYKEQFSGIDEREVSVHRVVNIVERSPLPREYGGSFYDDSWYGGSRSYEDTREYHPPSDRQYYDMPHYRRNPSPPRNEGPYSQQYYSRRDLRHRLASRSRSRGSPYFLQRGRGSGPPMSATPERKPKPLRSHLEDHGKTTTSVVARRGRAPGKREIHPPVRSGSNTSNKSSSVDRDKSHAPQQPNTKHKLNVSASDTPSSSVDNSPPSSGSGKEKTPASVTETLEMVAASAEPKPTPEDEDLKARRSKAILAKVEDIEKHFRHDCETFSTVVKMLVEKEPSLEGLLDAPLNDNLSELRQRCIDDLKHFMKELDEMLVQGGDKPEHGSPDTSTIFGQMEDDLPQLFSTNLAATEWKHDVERPPGNTEDSSLAPLENKGEGTGKQIENMEVSTKVSENHIVGRQVILSTSGPEHDDDYEQKMSLSKGPIQQGPEDNQQSSLQLHGLEDEILSNSRLSDPQVWDNIAYVKPGKVPNKLPFLQPGKQYWELKATSKVDSTRNVIYVKGWRKKKKKNMACRIIRYTHAEGPWCEVVSISGVTVCILLANRATTNSQGEDS
ncbi:periphilin-1-like [Antennarius striatus]|uniref:periphilin-1-like n=1 Tax=Antennarius striatus TaxID=241820 RepID=UPI0035B06518